ncbi:hypothetical protein AVEN_136520-1 [Araneus ventricosus]|uniref:Uncharacterized protein n=1 Tax=Araneus ventricosus TaxID=182803 RepID=A0A4Y2KNZ9_ARAVE|nr:hypothetical protein AVEN_136520-1 [Araneus ventricosus]
MSHLRRYHFKRACKQNYIQGKCANSEGVHAKRKTASDFQRSPPKAIQNRETKTLHHCSSRKICFRKQTSTHYEEPTPVNAGEIPNFSQITPTSKLPNNLHVSDEDISTDIFNIVYCSQENCIRYQKHPINNEKRINKSLLFFRHKKTSCSP